MNNHPHSRRRTRIALALGTTTYAGTTFASMVARGNVAAAQFHPEKSGRIGLRLLQNFLDWTPA